MANDLLKINQFPLDEDHVYEPLAYKAYMRAKPYFKAADGRYSSTDLVFANPDMTEGQFNVSSEGFYPAPVYKSRIRGGENCIKLLHWARVAAEIRRGHARAVAVLEQLQVRCDSARELHYMWPPIVALVPEGKEKIIYKRYSSETRKRRDSYKIARDEMDGRPPTHIPDLRRLKQPMRDVATWIADYSLIGASEKARLTTQGSVRAALTGQVSYSDNGGFNYTTP
jgi:hypothetical protein